MPENRSVVSQLPYHLLFVADPCGQGSKQNENWELNQNGTISSLQPNTPFCLGAKGTAAGAAAVLDACSASSADFKVGFAKGGTTGTIVQKASSLCLTVATGGVAPHDHSYQPMVRPSTNNEHSYSKLATRPTCLSPDSMFCLRLEKNARLFAKHNRQ